MHAKSHLQQLAKARLKDAEVLLNAQRDSAAYYLSGYAVELALKACIANVFQPQVIPDKGFVNSIHTHNLGSLMKLSGLHSRFQAEIKTNPTREAYWAIASNWSEVSRYEVWDRINAETMFIAVSDPKNGVYSWISQHW